MTTHYTLYHSPLLPSCRKIRLMLREKNLSYELRQEDFWQRRVEFFALNPAGEVPVLVGGKTPVVGAYAISEFLDERYPEIQFFGTTPEERAEVRRLVEWFDGKFDREVTQLVLFEKLYKRLLGYGEPSSEAIRAGKKNLMFHLDYLAHLLAGRNWLAGEYLTLADISAAAHLSSLDYFGDVPWEHNNAVKEWYMLLKSRPCFRELLEDRILGYKPPEHYMDLDF
jgi:glutathione S-transferase